MSVAMRLPSALGKARSFGVLLAIFTVGAALLVAAFGAQVTPVAQRPDPAVAPCRDGGPDPGLAGSDGAIAPRWHGDMEEGTLGDWQASGGRTEDGRGGGEYDSGSAWAGTTRTHVHSGAWGARLVLPRGNGGARLFRWRELRAYRTAIVRVWLKVPRRYQLTASRSRGRFWNVFQFKSRSASGRNDPLWFLDLADAPRRRLRLELIWWHRTLQGPHRGQSGFRRFTQSAASTPVGRWFQLTAQLRQSKDFDGVLCVWQDARLLFAMHNVRTSFPNCSYNAWCAADEWSLNNYSDGLSPAPAVVYADDASIAAG